MNKHLKFSDTRISSDIKNRNAVILNGTMQENEMIRRLRRIMVLQITRSKKQRIIYTITFVLLLLIEVLIALFVHDSFIRPYAGDILVVMVLYCFIRIFIPDKFILLPLYVFIFAAGVEILQYFNLVQILGLENNAFLRVLLGSVFDIKDIACYGAGCVILGAYEMIKAKHKTDN